MLFRSLDRISETTNFNGNKILSGDFLARDLQVGANVGETLSVSIEGAGTKDLARQVRTGPTTVTASSMNGFTISYGSGTTAGSAFVRSSNAGDDSLSTSNKEFSAISKAAAINSLTETTGVRAIVDETTASGTVVAGGNLDASNYLQLNGQKISGFAVQGNDADNSLVDAINAVSDETGVVASLDADSELVLTAADGRNIELSTVGNAGTVTGLNGGGLNAGGTTLVSYGQITLQSDDTFTIGDGTNAGTGTGVTSLGQGAGVFGVNSTNSVYSVDISDRAGAVKALDTIDLALENVSASRANLGALQNRLESTINNLSTTSENLSASRSRILDADFAAETAQLSRNQIIQQAGVSILAQANQQPQIALALLG